jgi:hypothetical protein
LRSLEKGVFLEDFRDIQESKKPEMEFRILQRMTLHQGHVKNLMNSPSVMFIRQNRFQEVLPCKLEGLILVKHSRVVLKDYQVSAPAGDASSLGNRNEFNDYINANYINVSLLSQPDLRAQQGREDLHRHPGAHGLHQGEVLAHDLGAEGQNDHHALSLRRAQGCKVTSTNRTSPSSTFPKTTPRRPER